MHFSEIHRRLQLLVTGWLEELRRHLPDTEAAARGVEVSVDEVGRLEVVPELAPVVEVSATRRSEDEGSEGILEHYIRLRYSDGMEVEAVFVPSAPRYGGLPGFVLRRRAGDHRAEEWCGCHWANQDFFGRPRAIELGWPDLPL